MMSSVKSWGSMGDSSNRETAKLTGDIIKMGYLKKLKTMKKKFFVLRGDSKDMSARLEYYDNEKKYKSHHSPKRSITIKTCFNINKRNDLRQKWVIALYTKNDVFCLVLETEEEMEEWLKALLSIQHGEETVDGELPKPTFEHVWQVTVQKKELGNSRTGIMGPYHLCLTDRILSLVKMGNDEKINTIEFSLQSIRRCGHMDSFFYMELGQASVTGAGNLWMQTDDANIAENMHASILSACSKKDLAPKKRDRSSSANEASKPIALMQRWPTHAEEMGRHFKGSGEMTSPAVSSTSIADTANHIHSATAQAGSLPAGSYSAHRALMRSATPRRHSVSASSGTMVGTNACGAPMHQRTYSFPFSPLPPSRRASTGTRPATKKPTTQPTSLHCLTAARDRCDSLPSRARTTSEGTPHLSHPPRTHLAPTVLHNRPHSMYNRGGLPHSPPVGSSPVSPASVACSTDSAGSSLSMDGEGGGVGGGVECNWEGLGLEAGRYSHSHCLTPDEPVIMEENCDDYPPWSPAHGGDEEKLNSYMQMDNSLSLPSLNNVSSRKQILNAGIGSFKPSSPSQGSYMDMSSPCGSSPVEPAGTYLPGDAPTPLYGRTNGSANHSRGSSLAEDGYVPMGGPVLSDDGYIDMDHGDQSRNDNYNSGDMSAGSSVTSGTPSTDIRFIEYTLDKVSTYFTPDLAPSDRPARCYSVGSRPTTSKTAKPEVVNQMQCERVRAFSVGSRGGISSTNAALGGRMPRHHATPPPQLSSSLSSVEPSEDLMELDFSHNKNRSRKKVPSYERLSVPGGGGSSAVSSAASSYSTAEGSYMEMSPRASPEMGVPSPPKTHRIFMGRSPPKYSDTHGFIKLSCSPPMNTSLYRVPETVAGYMDMTPGTKSDHGLLGTSPKSASKDCGYMEMLPGSKYDPSISGTSPPSTSSQESGYMEMTPLPGSTPPPDIGVAYSPRSNQVIAYMEMTPGLDNDLGNSPPLNNLNSPGSKDISNSRIQGVIASSAKLHRGQDDPYVEMKLRPDPIVTKPLAQPRVEMFPLKPHNVAKTTPSPPIKPALLSTRGVPTREDYMDMNLKRKILLVEDNNNSKMVVGRTTPVDTPNKVSDGYVEMTWNRPERKESLDKDYMNMSGGGRRERRNNRKDRNRYSSQPIAIQSTVSSNQPPPSSHPVFTFCGRKHSTGTPPKVPSYLTLAGSPSSSPVSSLGRNRGRKVQRKDSSSKDMNSGLTTPTGSTATIFPFSLNSPASPMRPPFSGREYDSAAKCPVDVTSGSVQLSYTESQSEIEQPLHKAAQPTQHDYVNMDLLSLQDREQPSSSLHEVKDCSNLRNSIVNADYAVMGPLSEEPTRKTSAPSNLGSSSIMAPRSADNLISGLSNLTISLPEIASSGETVSVTRPSGETGSSSVVEEHAPSVSQNTAFTSGERMLNYASLDLATGEERASSYTESSSGSTPSPNTQPTKFTYAQIDFKRQ